VITVYCEYMTGGIAGIPGAAPVANPSLPAMTGSVCFLLDEQGRPLRRLNTEDRCHPPP